MANYWGGAGGLTTLCKQVNKGIHFCKDMFLSFREKLFSATAKFLATYFSQDELFLIICPKLFPQGPRK